MSTELQSMSDDELITEFAFYLVSFASDSAKMPVANLPSEEAAIQRSRELKERLTKRLAENQRLSAVLTDRLQDHAKAERWDTFVERCHSLGYEESVHGSIEQFYARQMTDDYR